MKLLLGMDITAGRGKTSGNGRRRSKMCWRKSKVNGTLKYKVLKVFRAMFIWHHASGIFGKMIPNIFHALSVREQYNN